MDYQTTAGSRDVARAAIELSMTQSRDEEQRWRQTLRQQGVIGAAADFGGDFLTGIVRIVERAVVAAKREQGDWRFPPGGRRRGRAAREALNQVTPKAPGHEVWAEKSALPARESMWRWPCFLISAWDIWMRCVSVWGIGPFDR